MLKVHSACIQQEKTVRGIDQELAVSQLTNAIRHLEELPAILGGGQILELGTIKQAQCV